MGQQLLVTHPVFAASMEKAESHLLSLGAQWRLRDELCKPKDTSRINEAALSQPCCTAIQIALVDLLLSWGIRPNAVCGHSSGEICAAYAAGVLTAEDALKIAFFRGQTVRQLKEKAPTLSGGMVAVGLSSNGVLEYIDDTGALGNVVVACINSPSSVTLSGDVKALDIVQQKLDAKGIFNRKLAVDVAYHSDHMQLIQGEYLKAISTIKASPRKNNVQMVSSVTGQLVQGEDLNAQYWCKNLTSPVRFVDALTGVINAVRKNSKSTHPVMIIEIGPHSALAGPIKQTIKAAHLPGQIDYSSVLARNEDATRTALSLAGDLFVRKVDMNFKSINDPMGLSARRVLTNLPTYNWHHKTLHWNESRRSAKYRNRQFPKHDLLGVPTQDSIPTEPTWRNYIRLEELPWMSGHCVAGQIIFPAAGYISMTVEAVKQHWLTEGHRWKNMRVKFRHIHVGRALLIRDDGAGVEVFFTLRPYTYTAKESSNSWKEFRVFSVTVDGETAEHCRGLVTAIESSSTDQRDVESLNLIDDALKNCHTQVDPQKLYKELSEIGLDYSGPFKNLQNIRSSHSQSVCKIDIPNVQSIMPAKHQQPHCIHPATLDLCFQSVFSAIKGTGSLDSTFVLSGIDNLEVSGDIPSRPGRELLITATVKRFGHSKNTADLIVSGPKTQSTDVFVKIKGLTFTNSGGPSQRNVSQRPVGETLCHRVEWALDPSNASEQSIIERCNPETPDDFLGKNILYDKFCKAMIRNTLASLSPADEAKITGYRAGLYRWMKSINTDGVEDIHVGDEIYNKVRAMGVHGEVFTEITARHAGILCGEVDPLALLLENDRLYRIYTYENTNRCHERLAKYVQLLQFKNPSLRILEIGAGSASTSLPVLEALCGNQSDNKRIKLDRYTFTDISSGFFPKAEEKLKDFEGIVEFKRLDIESSPEEQGFELGSYDLIIASNVIHATREISNTLRNVRSLLKKDGKFALIEITIPQVYIQFIFGVLPGWWLGAADGRENSPLLEIGSWHDRLSHSGFSGVDVELQDYAGTSDHELSLMISTATSQDKPSGLAFDEDLTASVSSGSDFMLGGSTPQSASSEFASQSTSPRVSVTENNGIQDRTVRIVSTANEGGVANQLIKLMSLNRRGMRATTIPLLAVEHFENKLVIVLLEAKSSFLSHCSKAEWEKVRHMFASASGILWVTCNGAIEGGDPLQGLITGLSRSLRSENHSIRFSTVDLETYKGTDLEIAGNLLKIFEQSIVNRDPMDTAPQEWEYAIRNGEILIPRLMEDHQMDKYILDSVSTYHPKEELGLKQGRPMNLKIQVPGLLDTLYWSTSERHSCKVGPNQVRVEMEYVSLNFKDIMIAMGQLEGHTVLLIEGTGKIVDVGESLRDQYAIGDSVYVVDSGGIATTSNIDHWYVHHVPKNLSMEVTASIGCAYATALYALQKVANIQEGESILIHSGAGAVGQAAIALCQSLGVEDIFVTAGSDERRAFIRDNYGIPEENIFSSRNVDFFDSILRKTDGRGVDVVLNSLSGDIFQKSCDLLASFGRFVEIGKKDLISNARLEIGCLERNTTFATVDLSMLSTEKPSLFRKLYAAVINLISKGQVKLFDPITVKCVSELEETFRIMQAGKHLGKLIIKLDPAALIRVCSISVRKRQTNLTLFRSNQNHQLAQSLTEAVHILSSAVQEALVGRQ
jgi:acyl transferase domain-containing protein/NADPH:quinone reductase-like Zn-dependent oxidoreductase